MESLMLIQTSGSTRELRTIVDLQDIFQRFTFDSICSMVLAFDPNCLPNKLTRFPEVAVEKAFNKMEDTILYRHLVPRWFWNLQIWLQIGHENDSIAILRIVEQFFHDRISSSPEERSGFNYTKDDESNFDMLKAPVEESGMEQVDHKFLRDIAVNLLAARRDTISASLCWFFWLVSTHPNVETKILG
ncbi:cytochrome P450 86A7-like [Arachis ipaensis]|uniref:cytochrome P450 86A7-like n=1 Tax=Arachis ipaensis TaxID=130454 RepID=UPI000A2B2FF7|nr:cytochrome P450 86A7-like [Arachis ipaensis]XP_025637096.1 cytochrome P450 86A7-like [Arachis hypogaea]